MLFWGHNCLFFVFFSRWTNVGSRGKTLLLAGLQLGWGCHLGRGIDGRLKNWRWSLWWCGCVEWLSLLWFSFPFSRGFLQGLMAHFNSHWLIPWLIIWCKPCSTKHPSHYAFNNHCSEAAVYPMQSSWIPSFLPSCLCQYREPWAE